MKVTFWACAQLIGTVQLAFTSTVTPITKVLELLSTYQQKVIQEGESAHKLYEQAVEWCEDRSRDLNYELKTEKAQVEALLATIEEEKALIDSYVTKVGALGEDLATAEADLQKAAVVRTKEKEDFDAEEKQLSNIISAVERSLRILEKERQRGGASMLQVQNAGSLADAFSAMVEASMLNAADAAHLTSFVQDSETADDSYDDAEVDAEFSPPNAAAYESHTENIEKVLEELLDKANGQLDSARRKETSTLQNHELLKSSLEDQIRVSNKHMTETKISLAASTEKQSTAQGDLVVTRNEVKEDTAALEKLRRDCVSKASDYESASTARNDELKAITAAKKTLQQATGEAADLTYSLNQVSLMQVSSSSSKGVAATSFEVLRRVRALAKNMHSVELNQLSKRLSTVVRVSSSAGADPFAKVKGLIQDLLARLEDQAYNDAEHKAYCDRELTDSQRRANDKSNSIEKLTIQIDQMSSRSAQLKQDASALAKELSTIATTQASMDKLRQDEKAKYIQDTDDMEKGLDGVKKALTILRDYYAEDSQATGKGIGSTIVGLLEVIETDFAKGLAEIAGEERNAVEVYERETKENAVDRAEKETAAKYKQMESVALDKSIAEATSDRSGLQDQFNAVSAYLSKIQKQCEGKADTYELRKARRDKMLEGLKDALAALQGDEALIQVSEHRVLRGFR